MKEAKVAVRDGTQIAVAVYAPEGSERYPALIADSPVTDMLWSHYYQPNKIGQDTIWHGARHPSALVLPMME